MRKNSCSDHMWTSAFVMVSRPCSSAESIGAGSRNFGVCGIPQRLLNSNLAQFRDLDAASSLNGAQTPDFTLTIPGAGFLTAIAVDSEGTGYVVDRTAEAIYSYDDIGNINGAFTPDRTIQGAQTLMDGPIRVFLEE